MKTSLPKLLLIPLLLLLSSQVLHAFYDPQTQRWINRDPLGEQSIAPDQAAPASAMLIAERKERPNLHCFVRNTPVLHIDGYGLEVLCYYTDPKTGEPTCKPPDIDPRNCLPNLCRMACAAAGAACAGGCAYLYRGSPWMTAGCVDMCIVGAAACWSKCPPYPQ